jgi:coenzyme Q-binding protein COQ10
MPTFRSERKVWHSAIEMFDLVADVERYPEFVPLCTSLKVRKRSVDGEGREVLLSEMGVGFGIIRERFLSRVTLDKAKLKVLVEYVDGPFSHMENVWTFRDEPDGRRSVVSFFIDYDFRSRTLGSLMGSMFDAAFRKFAAAFEARADKIYGRA